MAARLRRKPWFPSHPERDVYVSLLQLQDPPASEGLLKAALLRRAVANVHRIFRIRDDKAALAVLLQKGSINDDLWNGFLLDEKELEAEIVEVVAEANTFLDGWGQVIFQTASEIVQNEKLREILMKAPQNKADFEAKFGGNPKPRQIPAALAVPLALTPSSSRPSSPAALSATLSPTTSEAMSPPPSATSATGMPKTPTSPTSAKKALKKRK